MRENIVASVAYRLQRQNYCWISYSNIIIIIIIVVVCENKKQQGHPLDCPQFIYQNTYNMISLDFLLFRLHAMTHPQSVSERQTIKKV